MSDSSAPRDLSHLGSVERQQALFLDGMRMSIDMAQISYRRLQETLVPDNSPESAAEASLDAWAVVDTLNRLRMLINRTPCLRRNSPGTQVIVRALMPVKTLRDAVQHMDEKVGGLTAINAPLWGGIAWVQRGPGEAVRSRSLLVGVGLGHMSVPMVTPHGKKIESPVGPIELTAAGTTISLSELVAASLMFRDRLERAVASASPNAEGRLVLDVL